MPATRPLPNFAARISQHQTESTDHCSLVSAHDEEAREQIRQEEYGGDKCEAFHKESQ